MCKTELRGHRDPKIPLHLVAKNCDRDMGKTGNKHAYGSTKQIRYEDTACSCCCDVQ